MLCLTQVLVQTFTTRGKTTCSITCFCVTITHIFVQSFNTRGNYQRRYPTRTRWHLPKIPYPRSYSLEFSTRFFFHTYNRQNLHLHKFLILPHGPQINPYIPKIKIFILTLFRSDCSALIQSKNHATNSINTSNEMFFIDEFDKVMTREILNNVCIS